MPTIPDDCEHTTFFLKCARYSAWGVTVGFILALFGTYMTFLIWVKSEHLYISTFLESYWNFMEISWNFRHCDMVLSPHTST